MSHLALAGAGRFGLGLSPSDISGLKLWLKADALALSDNDVVASWTDSSGLGNHFVQATEANKPIYKTSIVNGKPVIRFDGTDDLLVGPNLMSGVTAAEGLIVIKIVNDPPLVAEKSGLWDFGGDYSAHYTDQNKIYDAWGSTERKDTGNPAPNLASAFRLYNVSSAANSWINRLDGVQHFSTGTNTVGWSTATPRIGRSQSGTTFLDGDIAEVIIYDSVLSAADRKSLEVYIAAKYGLTYS